MIWKHSPLWQHILFTILYFLWNNISVNILIRWYTYEEYLHFTPLIDFKRDPSNAIKISFFSNKKLGIEFLIVEGFLVCGIKYQSGNHVQVYTDKNFCVSWCNKLYTTKYNNSSFCLSLRCYISHSINIHPISTVPFLHSLKIFFEQIWIFVLFMTFNYSY